MICLHSSAQEEKIYIYIYVYILTVHAVAQLVEALPYNPEGRGLIPDDVIGIFH